MVYSDIINNFVFLSCDPAIQCAIIPIRLVTSTE